jgi:hypothetical protein
MGQLSIKDRVILFDDADADLVGAYQWHLHLTPTVTYARGYPHGQRAGGLTYMHRLLTGAERGRDVDHINHDGLDNRRANLRVCSRSQNTANRHVAMSASGVKGVHFEACTGRWRAELGYQGKRFRLGRFDTLEDAADAYSRKAREVFGEFANPVG